MLNNIYNIYGSVLRFRLNGVLKFLNCGCRMLIWCALIEINNSFSYLRLLLNFTSMLIQFLMMFFLCKDALRLAIYWVIGEFALKRQVAWRRDFSLHGISFGGNIYVLWPISMIPFLLLKLLLWLLVGLFLLLEIFALMYLWEHELVFYFWVNFQPCNRIDFFLLLRVQVNMVVQGVVIFLHA